MVKMDQPCGYYNLITSNNQNLPTNLTANATDTYYIWNMARCNTTYTWYIRHRYDSYDFYWAGALIAFLLGAYQIACAAALVYCDEFAPEEKKIEVVTKHEELPKVDEKRHDVIPPASKDIKTDLKTEMKKPEAKNLDVLNESDLGGLDRSGDKVPQIKGSENFATKKT